MSRIDGMRDAYCAQLLGSVWLIVSSNASLAKRGNGKKTTAIRNGDNLIARQGGNIDRGTVDRI